jgi:hypothetical protein
MTFEERKKANKIAHGKAVKVIKIECDHFSLILDSILIGSLACAINTVNGLTYEEGKEKVIESFNSVTSDLFELDTDDEHGTMAIFSKGRDNHFGYFCFELVDGRFDVVNFLNKNKYTCNAEKVK